MNIGLLCYRVNAGEKSHKIIRAAISIAWALETKPGWLDPSGFLSGLILQAELVMVAIDFCGRHTRRCF